MSQLKKCNDCGKQPDFKWSVGGPCSYVVVECECGKTTRGKGVMRGLVPLGMGESNYAPQNNTEEATDRWKIINP